MTKAGEQPTITQVDRDAFEAWARHNVGQFSPAGYHGTGGVWFYRHNIQQLMWVCWRAALASCGISRCDRMGKQHD